VGWQRCAVVTKNRVTAARLTGEEGAARWVHKLLQGVGLSLVLHKGERSRLDRTAMVHDGGKTREASGDAYHADKKATGAQTCGTGGSLIGVRSVGTKQVVGLAGAKARAEGAAASTNGMCTLYSRGTRRLDVTAD
jgi:hypothetical protein